MRKNTVLQSFFCLLFLLSFCCISCNQSAPPTQQKLDSIELWIKQHAIPFTTAEPGMPDNNLQPLKQLVGTASIVGLGEETHGTHEFFAMKERIIMQHPGPRPVQGLRCLAQIIHPEKFSGALPDYCSGTV